MGWAESSSDVSLSIIVPMLNEARTLPAMLPDLKRLQEEDCEVLFVDGGSEDASVDIAMREGFTVLQGSRGRARQMNAGARAARGRLLLFLHADTRLPADAPARLRRFLSEDLHAWGFFSVEIQGESRMLRLVSALMNLRSKLSCIATGDQALFMYRVVFNWVGGFPDQPLMEDVELSRRLKRISRPTCLPEKVTTSGRRWETSGICRTIVLMWFLRLAYWFGVSPKLLARAYR
ncbi:MAG: TIGR04283 family arsenosugar biosynthesis glycosyltransferase [Proteobacteria bacterium]|nr:TIGR04283 family arsenosugar biosynthesis glycosyltransferase [Pseudomonadota bacterium]